MQEYIGGTGVKTWVERIISPGRYIQKSGELSGFATEANISGSRPGTDTRRSEGPGLLARELIYTNKQTRPLQVNRVQMVNRKAEPESARSVPSDTNAGKSLETSIRNILMPANKEESQIQASADEQGTERTSSGNGSRTQPQIDPKKVADKVYRLMQHDLILEGERATKIGG